MKKNLGFGYGCLGKKEKYERESKNSDLGTNGQNPVLSISKTNQSPGLKHVANLEQEKESARADS